MTKNYRRIYARQLALQALYQWQMAGQDLAQIEQQFMEPGAYDFAEDTPSALKVDKAYFHELLHEIPAHLTQLDPQIQPHMNRPLEQVDPVERAILRIGAYELMFRPEVHHRIILNEAIELAKRFGAEQSHRFVNGVLDKVRYQVRQAPPP